MRNEILTTHEIAQALSVDISTVIDWIDRNRLPAYRTPGGHRRVKRDDLLRFAARHHLPLGQSLGRSSRVVLIVEDEPDFRQVLREVIKRDCQGAAVYEAEDGFMAGRQIEKLQPDVVILDLFLPGINGFKVCRQIRMDPRLADTLIVAVSGYDTEENRRAILALGADVFFSKTSSVSDLGGIVNNLMRQPRVPAGPDEAIFEK